MDANHRVSLRDRDVRREPSNGAILSRDPRLEPALSDPGLVEDHIQILACHEVMKRYRAPVALCGLDNYAPKEMIVFLAWMKSSSRDDCHSC
jgi:hypothetical protein